MEKLEELQEKALNRAIRLNAGLSRSLVLDAAETLSNDERAISDLFFTKLRAFDKAQADSTKNGKIDLNLEYAALTETPLLGRCVEDFLASSPSRKVHNKIRVTGAPFDAQVKFDREYKTGILTLKLVPNEVILPLLGPEVSSLEVLRTITLYSRYAKWRDRRVRRLTRVTVDCHYSIPLGRIE